jgi:hypothetical protein
MPFIEWLCFCVAGDPRANWPHSPSAGGKQPWLELGVARQLHDRAERDINEVGQPVAYSPQALRGRFMKRVDRLLTERSMEVSEVVASELDDLVLDMTAVDKDLMRSPLARQQRLREIAASA